MDELVTIIVPVYNKRKYLRRCVHSLIDQTYTALHLVLVDDGSTDGSGDMCDELARQDTRIEVIHQANGGLSAARNAGLDSARGEWVAFVDSDDYVSPYYIEDMLIAAVRDNCDIAACRNIIVQEDDDRCAFWRTKGTQCITGREACISHFDKGAEILNTSCGKLFRIRLWAELRFPENKINEDLFVSHELFYRAERIALLDAGLYAYVQTSGSIMRKTFTPQRLDVLDSWQESIRFYSAVGESGLTHIARRVYCSRVFDARCICKRKIPGEREILRLLRVRAKDAYTEAKPIRGYIDCSSGKSFAYCLKLILGRWCLPLYSIIFTRGREYI